VAVPLSLSASLISSSIGYSSSASRVRPPGGSKRQVPDLRVPRVRGRTQRRRTQPAPIRRPGSSGAGVGLRNRRDIPLTNSQEVLPVAGRPVIVQRPERTARQGRAASRNGQSMSRRAAGLLPSQAAASPCAAPAPASSRSEAARPDALAPTSSNVFVNVSAIAGRAARCEQTG
jgi:hypothetical protein